MSAEKLLKTLPVLHEQLDALLEFEASPQDLNNGVINAAFVLLFKDLIRLFACYNDGIINLLEKYFDMNKKNAREALDIYKRFLIRMDRVGEFLKVAEVRSPESGSCVIGSNVFLENTKLLSQKLNVSSGTLSFTENCGIVKNISNEVAKEYRYFHRPREPVI